MTSGQAGVEVGVADDDPDELEADRVAVEVATRTADPHVLDLAIAAGRRQTTLPVTLQWRPHTLAAGYAGTALLFAAVDARHPGEGWDRIGHEHLAAACAATERTPSPGTSLFGGVAGVGYAAVQLAGGRERYRRLLASVDRAVLPATVRAARRVDALDGCGVDAFDLISGLSGVGVYLLERRDDPDCRAVLEHVLESLVRLLGDGRQPPRWRTPEGQVAGPMGTVYPFGNLNCGLAHGLPGPLAVLSLATLEGIHVNGAAGAVAAAAGWLAAQVVVRETGPDWPNAVGLPGPDGSVVGAAPVPGRVAWCYGSPGVARALWLAGTAVDDPAHRELALRTMHSALARPREQRGLTSPTFCHGTAGLRQVVVRFARDTGSRSLAMHAAALTRELVDEFDPGSLLGFRNVEPGTVLVDAPGLLDGAPGVALSLLAAGPTVEPTWDRLFLLS